MHRSMWLQEALAEDASPVCPTLVGPHRADVCIVGGGYTGLWTALAIKRLAPACDVALVEADICGGGASGRNGGFCTSWWSKLPTLIDLCGEAEGMRLAHAAAAAIGEIEEFCRLHAIDARMRRNGWLWVATAPVQLDTWEPSVAACEQRGVNAFVRLTPEELHGRIDQPTHLGGVWEPGTATVQPAALARGLRRVALEQGVRIFEGSPMRRLRRGRPAEVRTRSGRVTADMVVLALNAWTAAVPELRRSLIPVSSDVVATGPVPEVLEGIGWTGGEAIADGRLRVHYYHATEDGRIVFGKGGGTLAFAGHVDAGFHHDERRAAGVAAQLHRILPAAAGAEVTHSWSGPVARTADGLPAFGSLSDGVVFGAGYSGNGVGPSHVGGRILASLALRRSDEWSGCGLVRRPPRAFPPEPLRYLGGLAVRAAVTRKECAEDAGSPPGPVTRRLAGYAPAGFARRGGRGR
jgi:putative aminophosphonate oxidoreductase